MSDASFNRHVLDWLQERRPEAGAVTVVTGHGSDWAGDTEGGFYSTFAAEIRYVNRDGTTTYLNVEGEDMDSLWKWVVNRDWS